jgi:hypothetical protein
MGQSLNSVLNKKSASVLALFFFITLLSPRESSASSTDAIDTEVGISALRFNYKELDDVGALLDKEQGGIPGITVKLGLRRSFWEWEGTGNYHQGRAAYSGQTQEGVPYNTKTDERIGDVSLRFGPWLGQDQTIMPYAGVGYRHWDRNILAGSAGTTPVGSLFETYGWSYVWVGTKFRSNRRNSSGTIFDIGFIRPIRPELHVGPDATAYSLQGKTGLRMMLTSSINLSRNTRLVIEPYYEHWQLGRSPTIITSTGYWYEPNSNARNLGLNLRLGWTL